MIDTMVHGMPSRQIDNPDALRERLSTMRLDWLSIAGFLMEVECQADANLRWEALIVRLMERWGTARAHQEAVTRSNVWCVVGNWSGAALAKAHELYPLNV